MRACKRYMHAARACSRAQRCSCCCCCHVPPSPTHPASASGWSPGGAAAGTEAACSGGGASLPSSEGWGRWSVHMRAASAVACLLAAPLLPLHPPPLAHPASAGAWPVAGGAAGASGACPLVGAPLRGGDESDGCPGKVKTRPSASDAAAAALLPLHHPFKALTAHLLEGGLSVLLVQPRRRAEGGRIAATG